MHVTLATGKSRQRNDKKKKRSQRIYIYITLCGMPALIRSYSYNNSTDVRLLHWEAFHVRILSFSSISNLILYLL